MNKATSDMASLAWCAVAFYATFFGVEYALWKKETSKEKNGPPAVEQLEGSKWEASMEKDAFAAVDK